MFWEKDYLTIEDGRFAEEETFYLSFSSASIPMHPGDNPRGWRPWRGTFEVSGATLVNAEPTDFFNADIQNFSVDENNSNLVHFATSTRGDDSSLKLTLRDISRRAAIKLDLVEVQEVGSGPPIYRSPATLPATTLTLALKDLQRGTVSFDLPFDIYDDQVTIRRRIDQGSMDVSFEVEDTSAIQGDYYFVRITQANDAIAWSSPIWVGGYPSR